MAIMIHHHVVACYGLWLQHLYLSIVTVGPDHTKFNHGSPDDNV